MFESGSAKPVRIVGIPLSASAGTIGSVPPERTSRGRVPSARSNAWRPSWTARLLLSITADAEVDRQRLVPRQLLGRLQEHVELALVVGDSARIDAPVANGRLERVRLPQLERRRRLDVEVSVADNRGRVGVCRRRLDLTEREWMAVPIAQLGRAARPSDELAHPLTRLLHVARARGVSADAGDANELGELVEPGVLHGAAV